MWLCFNQESAGWLISNVTCFSVLMCPLLLYNRTSGLRFFRLFFLKDQIIGSWSLRKFVAIFFLRIRCGGVVRKLRHFLTDFTQLSNLGTVLTNRCKVSQLVKWCNSDLNDPKHLLQYQDWEAQHTYVECLKVQWIYPPQMSDMVGLYTPTIWLYVFLISLFVSV